MSDDAYFVSDGGRELGAYPERSIVAMVRAGSVSPRALLWREGMPDWVALPAHVQEMSPEVTVAAALARSAPMLPTYAPPTQDELATAAAARRRVVVPVRSSYAPAHRPPNRFMTGFLITLGVVAALAAVGYGTGFVQRLVQGQTITYNTYFQVERDMSYEQVVAIAGREGRQTSSASTEGIGTLIPAMELRSYQWANSDGSNMVIAFNNGRVWTKAQFGLK